MGVDGHKEQLDNGVVKVGSGYVRPDTLHLLLRSQDKVGDIAPKGSGTVTGNADKIEAMVTDGEQAVLIVFHRE